MHDYHIVNNRILSFIIIVNQFLIFGGRNVGGRNVSGRIVGWTKISGGQIVGWTKYRGLIVMTEKLVNGLSWNRF